MMPMLTSTARGDRRTLDSMAMPCSVNAYGKYFTLCPRFKITFCDLEALTT